MKRLSLFYILLLFNDSIQLNYLEHDTYYIQKLVNDFSVQKQNRMLKTSIDTKKINPYNRDLRKNEFLLKKSQQEFFIMIRNQIFHSIKIFLEKKEVQQEQEKQQSKFNHLSFNNNHGKVHTLKTNEQFDYENGQVYIIQEQEKQQLQNANEITKLNAFVFKNFKFYQTDQKNQKDQKEDYLLELEDNKFQDILQNFRIDDISVESSKNQFYQLILHKDKKNDIQYHNVLTIKFVPLLTKDKNKKIIKNGIVENEKKVDKNNNPLKEDKKIKRKDMTIIFKNDITESKMKIPVVLGKNNQILEFISENVNEFLEQSLQIVHDVQRIKKITFQILSYNFSIKNFDVSKEIKDFQSYKQNEGNSGSSTGDSDFQIKDIMSEEILKDLDFEVVIYSEEKNSDQNNQSQNIQEKQLQFILIPNYTELDYINVDIKIKDKKIDYSFKNDFLSFENSIEISTYSFYAESLNSTCEKFFYDLKLSYQLLYQYSQSNSNQNQFLDYIIEKFSAFKQLLSNIWSFFWKKSEQQPFEQKQQKKNGNISLSFKYNLSGSLDKNNQNQEIKQQDKEIEIQKVFPISTQFILNNFYESFIHDVKIDTILIYKQDEKSTLEQHYKHEINKYIKLDQNTDYINTNWWENINLNPKKNNQNFIKDIKDKNFKYEGLIKKKQLTYIELLHQPQENNSNTKLKI